MSGSDNGASDDGSEETDADWASFFADESGEHAACSNVAECFQQHEATPQIKMIDLMCKDMCEIYQHPVGRPRRDYNFMIPLATSLGRDPVRLRKLPTSGKSTPFEVGSNASGLKGRQMSAGSVDPKKSLAGPDGLYLKALTFNGVISSSQQFVRFSMPAADSCARRRCLLPTRKPPQHGTKSKIYQIWTMVPAPSDF